MHLLYLEIWMFLGKCQIVQCSTVVQLVENYHLRAGNEMGLTLF